MSDDPDRLVADLIAQFAPRAPAAGEGPLGEAADCVPLSELVDQADELWSLDAAAQRHVRGCAVCQARLRTAYEAVDPSPATLAASLRDDFAGAPAIGVILADSPRLRVVRRLIGWRRSLSEGLEALAGATSLTVPTPAQGYALDDPGPVFTGAQAGFVVTIERIAESTDIVVTVRTDRPITAVDVVVGGEAGTPCDVRVALHSVEGSFIGDGLLGTTEELRAQWPEEGEGEVGVVLIPVVGID